MSNIKEIKAHAISVGNIQKITNTIKMVATSKYMVAEKIMRRVRHFGNATRKFYEVSKVSYDPRKGTSAVVTSDRGLCGGLHTKICRQVKIDQTNNPSEGGIVCLGEKARSLLAINFKRNFRLVVNGVGHKNPTFKLASTITPKIFGDWNLAMLTFPYFHNIMSTDVISVPIMTSDFLSNASAVDIYELDQDDLEFYLQFSAVSLVYYALNEAFVSELGNRITAMSAASRSAGKVKKQLMLQYNRKRQERITTEIIDIISGLKATDKGKKKRSKKMKYLFDGDGGNSPSGLVPEFLADVPLGPAEDDVKTLIISDKPDTGQSESGTPPVDPCGSDPSSEPLEPVCDFKRED